MLYRLFPHDPGAPAREEGGALHAPRALQGRGRHDHPERYGVLYASRREVSVVAEFLWQRGLRDLDPGDLRSETGHPYAVARLDDSSLTALLDLDDPALLSERSLRPSVVATRDRERTQAIAVTAFEEGAAGLEWWSTLEASWINVTLFAERAASRLELAADPEPLTTEHPAVREAAEMVGVLLP
jgi:hypothetical protein